MAGGGFVGGCCGPLIAGAEWRAHDARRAHCCRAGLAVSDASPPAAAAPQALKGKDYGKPRMT